MSFSGEVKQELVKKINPARHCQIAELAAFLHFSGQFGIDEYHNYRIGFQLENEDILRKGFTLLKKTFNIDTDIILTEENMNDITSKFGDLNQPVSSLLIKNSCCQRAFLRGAFLCIGSMSAPEKG